MFRKRNTDKKFWVIFIYAVVSFFSDALPSILRLDRFYSFSFFTLIEYAIFSYFFYLSYKERSFKWLLVCCFPIFCGVLAFSVINKYKSNFDFDYLSSSFEAIMIIIFSILFFYEQLKNPENDFVYASKSFWIIIAMLLYMSATLFLFISTSVLSTNTVWNINNGANIIKNILFAVAFYKPITLAIDLSFNNSAR